ncbi:MAG: FtsX-like permease family protein [Planctomycetes bacterium]|nr:FtsX-like permease family protein [Planctomycetota bacterium]
MRALNRKLAREICRSKGLLLAITSIIAVGVMCYVAMQSAYLNLSAAKTRYYRMCRMADFWVDVKKVPLAELEALGRIRGVAEYQPRITFPATVDLENVPEPLNGQVISLPDRREPTLNDILLRQGGYFTDRRENEVIVNDAFARARNIYPGQWIHLLLNDRRQELFVVGTAISSEFTYLLGPGTLVPDPETYGVFYVKRTFAEDVFDFDGAANQVVGRLSPELAGESNDTLRSAETLLEPYGVFSVTPLRLQASNQFLSNEIEGLGAIAAVVPTIFLAVAAVVLNVLITRLARQQRVVIGTLKALGYTNGQVFAHFLKFGLSVGVAGGVLGALLGYTASAGMTQVYQHFFQFPDLRSQLHWNTFALGMAVSLVCAIAGSLHGAWSMLQLQPAEAMRPEPPARGGAILLERLTLVWKLFSSGWRLALRSVFRHRVRSAAAVFAAMMGAALLVTGFMMVQSQDYFLDFQFYRTMRSDIDLVLKGSQGREALDEVRQLPGVDHAEPQLMVAGTFEHGPFRRKEAIIGLLPDARLTIPHDAEGRRIPLPRSGLVLSRRMAEILHVRPGDQVSFTPVQEERRTLEATVAQIADSYMGLTIYADIHYLSRLMGEEFAVSGVQLQTDPRPDVLRRLNHELKQLPGVEAISDRQRLVENLTKTLLQNQFVFIGVLVIFAGVIFFGSVVNSSMVNLAERQREVATFRALGYSKWSIGAMFLRESLLTNMTGAVLGLPIGYGLMWLTATAYANDLVRLPVIATPAIWGWALGWAVVFALLAHAVVQWRINTMNYLEALKVKE